MTAPNVRPAVRREALARLRSEIGDEIFAEVVAVFLEETPLKVARIIEAAAAGELSSVASAAHGLKSTSGTLGADALVEVAASIETHARSNRLAETQAQVAKLSVLYREVERVLRAQISRP